MRKWVTKKGIITGLPEVGDILKIDSGCELVVLALEESGLDGKFGLSLYSLENPLPINWRFQVGDVK